MSFSESKNSQLISYPKTINPKDIKDNGLLLTDSEIKKTMEVLSKQPNKRFSKQELKELGLDFNYSIIKDDNRYFIIYKKNIYLGKGSEGKVKLAQYIGNDLETKNDKTHVWSVGKLLAMKVTYANSDIRTKLNEEQKILEVLGRAHTKVIEREKHGVVKYQFLQEYLPGKNIQDYLTEMKNISFKTALTIMFSSLTQMQFLHAKGILHCDIKCLNAIYDEKSETTHFVDFGLAMNMDNRQQAYSYSGSRGTRGYMAPEIERPGFFARYTTYDEKTEMYALGELFRNVFSYINDTISSDEFRILLKLKSTIDSMTDKDRVKRPSSEMIYHFFEKLPLQLQPKSFITPADKKSIVEFLNLLDSSEHGWEYFENNIKYAKNQETKMLIENMINNGKKFGLSGETLQELQSAISSNKSIIFERAHPFLLLQLREAAKKYEAEAVKEFFYHIKKR